MNKVVKFAIVPAILAAAFGVGSCARPPKVEISLHELKLASKEQVDDATEKNALQDSLYTYKTNDDSLAMVEAVKAMKGINLNRLSHDYDLASQKRENARNEVEIAKKDGKLNIVKEKEAKMQKVIDSTQPIVDKYEYACRIKQLTSGDEWRKSKEMRDLLHNKSLMNILNKYGFILIDANTVVRKEYACSLAGMPIYDSVMYDFSVKDNIVMLSSKYNAQYIFDLKTGNQIDQIDLIYKNISKNRR